MLADKIARKSADTNEERKSIALNSPEAFSLFDIRPTYSGANVSGEKALFIPAVLQAIRLISEQAGSLPCKLWREGNEDGKQEAKNHTAYRIVHRRAIEWASAREFREVLTADALIYGSGFALLNRYEDGRPFTLQRLQPSKVTVLQDEYTGAPFYRVSQAEGVREYGYTEVLQLSSFLGKSPIHFGKEAIGLASVLERHGAQFFKSGARPAGILKNIKAMGGDDGHGGDGHLATIARRYRNWQAASDIPLILDRDWDYKLPALTSTDSQYLENRIFQIDEVARVFGVPPHLLFELSRATWSNAEQMGASFLQLCLRTWLDRWQEAYETVLLTEEEQDSHYFEFVVDDLLRTDAEARTKNLTELVRSRLLSPNEGRAVINKPPYAGGDEFINPNTTSTRPTPDNGDDKE